jgi:hypothetical protein
MTNDQIGAYVMAFLGGGGGLAVAGWALQRAYEWVGRCNGYASQIEAIAHDQAEIQRDCKACRERVDARLEDGTGEFAKTRIDLLATSKDAAIENAKMREEFFQRFVNEATFKDRVLAHMVASCGRCRGDQK